MDPFARLRQLHLDMKAKKLAKKASKSAENAKYNPKRQRLMLDCVPDLSGNCNNDDQLTEVDLAPLPDFIQRAVEYAFDEEQKGSENAKVKQNQAENFVEKIKKPLPKAKKNNRLRLAILNMRNQEKKRQKYIRQKLFRVKKRDEQQQKEAMDLMNKFESWTRQEQQRFTKLQTERFIKDVRKRAKRDTDKVIKNFAKKDLSNKDKLKEFAHALINVPGTDLADDEDAMEMAKNYKYAWKLFDNQKFSKFTKMGLLSASEECYVRHLAKAVAKAEKETETSSEWEDCDSDSDDESSEDSCAESNEKGSEEENSTSAESEDQYYLSMVSAFDDYLNLVDDMITDYHGGGDDDGDDSFGFENL